MLSSGVLAGWRRLGGRADDPGVAPGRGLHVHGLQLKAGVWGQAVGLRHGTMPASLRNQRSCLSYHFMQGSPGSTEEGKETLQGFVTSVTSRTGKALSLVIVDQEKCCRYGYVPLKEAAHGLSRGACSPWPQGLLQDGVPMLVDCPATLLPGLSVGLAVLLISSVPELRILQGEGNRE